MKNKMVRDVLIIAVMVLVAVGITVYTKNKGGEKTPAASTESASQVQQPNPHEGGMPMGVGGDQNLFAQWLAVAMSQADIKYFEDQPEKENIAEVNGVAVKRADFEKRLELKMAVLTKSNMHGEQVDAAAITEDQKKEIAKQVLDQMVDEAFIQAEAEARNVAISDEEFEAAINSRKESIGGDEKFQELLKSHGISEDQMRSNLRKEMTQQNLSRAIMPEMKKMMGDMGGGSPHGGMGDMGGGSPHGGMGGMGGGSPHGGMGGDMGGSPHGGMGAPSGDSPHGAMPVPSEPAPAEEGEAAPHDM